jgi:hypothetical protein
MALKFVDPEKPCRKKSTEPKKELIKKPLEPVNNLPE